MQSTRRWISLPQLRPTSRSELRWPGRLATPSVEAVFRAFGFDPAITDTASNHTSAALRAGIPAVGIGTAPCEGAHAVHESCEIEPIFAGIKRMIALAVALSE